MNVCIIAPRYPYKDNMEFVFVKKLVDEWAKNGHRCIVITTDFSWITFFHGRIDYKPKCYSYDVQPSVSVDVYNPRTISTKIKIGKLSLDLWLASRSIERQLEFLNVKFDFIYCHFFSCALLAYKCAQYRNIPLFIATGESNISVRYLPSKDFSLENFKKFTRGVIAVSSKNMKEAAELGLIDSSKCEVFPNGTDLNVFHPLDRNECRYKLNLPQDLFIISCVGFICERKGQNRLLEAVRSLGENKIKLLFLGEKAKLESFVLEGDEILFEGSIENKDIPTYLCASDVFCLPTRAEGCCNAIIEAMACGLPVISSDLPFNWDVLDGSNSIMVNPDSVEEIAIAIDKLYNDKQLREKLSKGALAKASSLGIKQRAEGIMDFITENLSHKNV